MCTRSPCNQYRVINVGGMELTNKCMNMMGEDSDSTKVEHLVEQIPGPNFG